MPVKQLWAPWRMDYLSAHDDRKKDGCVFCLLPKEKPESEKDRGNLILYRGKKVFVIMNKYPYANGHLMVVPYRHTSDYGSLTADELSEMNAMTQNSIKALEEAYKPQGYNLGMNLGKAAGAGIEEHLHMHVVPRWVGDTNFMPVLADIRSMPQHLESAYDAIFGYFKRL